jgi:hypothetical protein
MAFNVLFLFHKLWFSCFPSDCLMAGCFSPPHEQIEFSDRRLFTLSLKFYKVAQLFILNE